MKNNLQIKRAKLKLTMDQLADQENVQFGTICALENDSGVRREKARAMRMLIRLGIPYTINTFGSIFVENNNQLKDSKETMIVVYDDKYYEGANLGNGLMQRSNGDVTYNELRDAIAQSGMDVETFSNHHNVPVHAIKDLAAGNRRNSNNVDIVDLLDELLIGYKYTDTDRMYIARNFKVIKDSELASYLESSLYQKRVNDIRTNTKINLEKKPEPLRPAVPVLVNGIIEKDVRTPIVMSSSNNVSTNSQTLLASVKMDLKKLLGDNDWDQKQRDILKEAFTVIGVRELQYELIDL